MAVREGTWREPSMATGGGLWQVARAGRRADSNVFSIYLILRKYEQITQLYRITCMALKVKSCPCTAVLQAVTRISFLGGEC